MATTQFYISISLLDFYTYLIDFLLIRGQMFALLRELKGNLDR